MARPLSQPQSASYARHDSPSPGGWTRRRLALRRFFPSRARLHPIFLVPVFLCGTFLAPYVSVSGPNGAVLQEPVYRPLDQDWSPQQVLAPADAPPLRQEDDYAGAFVPSRADAAGKRRSPAQGGYKDEDDADDEQWESDDGTETSSPFLVHDGLLYFRTSATLIPEHRLERPFPVAPARHPPANQRAGSGAVAANDGGDSPPPAPRDWLAPGEIFAHPPGRRKHVVAAGAAGAGGAGAGAAQRRQATVPLHAPIPPAPRRQAVPQQQQQQQQGVRDPPQQIWQRGGEGAGAQLIRDERGRMLGPNAAAMARAKKEGKPFVPGTPAELLAAIRKARQKKMDESQAKKRKMEEAAVIARQRQAAAIREQQRIGLEKQLRQEQEAAAAAAAAKAKAQAQAMQPGVGLRRVDTDGKAPSREEDDEAALWAAQDEQDNEDLLESLGGPDADDELSLDDDEDDEALLAAVHALTPAELRDLTPEERALVAELEASAAAKQQRQAPLAAARGGGAGAARANAPQRPVARAAPAGQQGQNRHPPAHAQQIKVDQEAERKRKMAALAGQPHRRAKRGLDVDVESSPDSGLAVSGEAPADSVPATPSNPSDPNSPGGSSAGLQRRASIPTGAKPDRLHPITHLIAEAEVKWEDMLRRQSQSLEQAVAEYKRRYKMSPPTGFDSWWRYAMQNRVVLVDEYDQIYDDILPFLSLPPSEFRRRVSTFRTDTSLPWHDFSFSFRIKDGRVEFPASGSGAEQKNDLLELLEEIAKMLPDLDLRMNNGDEPAVVISGEARQRHEDLAKRHKLLPTAALFEVAEPSGFSPWDSLCRPNSTARRLAQGLPVDTPKSRSLQSFVALEQDRAQDVCLHPDIRELNGFTAWSGPRPHLLYPIFSPVKTSVHADMLVPSLTSDFYAEIGRDPVWEQKKFNQVLWRGETTGAYHAKGTGWRKTHRARLVQLANEVSGETAFHIADPSASDSLRLMRAPSKDVPPLYFDVAYSGAPMQCSTKDGTCAALQREYRFDLEMTAAQENQYKYVLDVDANYASGTFKRLMSSRSLVFKSTIFREWWTKRIMPWYHYIPIQSDYSDLLDAATYFIGAPDGVGSHDQAAKRIAQQGKNWSQEHWREADVAAYLFRLLLEYARLLNRDEDDLHSMDFS